jgi:hypothetical protein
MMMATRAAGYFPRSYVRRQMIAASSYWTGLDFVNARGRGPGRWELTLHFIPAAAGAGAKRPVPAGIDRQAIRVRRLDGSGALAVLAVRYPEDRPLELRVDVATPAGATSAEPAAEGSWSLSIAGVPCLDAIYTRAELRLPGALSVPLDPGGVAPEGERWPTDVDYLSKDYNSFKVLILEYLAERDPAWKERSEADIGIMLVDLLAFAGDYLSAYQDAVGTEAYLSTARLRTSIRRHALLLGYALSEGCNARVWVHCDLESETSYTLAGGTLIRAGDPVDSPLAGPPPPPTAGEARTLFFETMYQVELFPRHNRMPIYAWRSDDYALPAGATGATLRGHFPSLRKGDVLIFQSSSLDVEDPPLAHAARLSAEPVLGVGPLPDEEPQPITTIEWFLADALPAALPVCARSGGRVRRDLTTVLGNNVAADQGCSELAPEPLTVGDEEKVRLQLRVDDLTYAVPFDPAAAAETPASETLLQDPAAATAQVVLIGRTSAAGGVQPAPAPCLSRDDILARRSTWRSVRSLVQASRYARQFVVEQDIPSRASIRFGDGRNGRRPEPGTTFAATWRSGSGSAGNIAANTPLALAVAPLLGEPALPPPIRSLSNPLPAAGGQAAESLDSARLTAPQQIDDQRRMVIEADYVRAALEFDGVIDAWAALAWNGSWYTATVRVQLADGDPMTPSYHTNLLAWLMSRRLMGVSLAVRDAIYVGADVLIEVTPARGVSWPELAQRLRAAFSPDAFFRPDRFHFGEALYASQILSPVMALDGVAGARLLRLQRVGEPPPSGPAPQLLPIAADEIVEVRSDPHAPARGQIAFTPGGGA